MVVVVLIICAPILGYSSLQEVESDFLPLNVAGLSVLLLMNRNDGISLPRSGYEKIVASISGTLLDHLLWGNPAVMSLNSLVERPLWGGTEASFQKPQV